MARVLRRHENRPMSIDVDRLTGTVRLDLQGSYTPAQLLSLVKELAAARAQLVDDPAEPGEMWLAPRAACHTKLLGARGPDTLIGFRFPGLGWIGATLGSTMRARLLSLLAAQQVNALPAEPAAPAPAVVKVEMGPGNSTLH